MHSEAEQALVNIKKTAQSLTFYLCLNKLKIYPILARDLKSLKLA